MSVIPRHRLAALIAPPALAMLLVAVAVWPAARREPALDDVAHLVAYPVANAGHSLTGIAALPHWQDVAGDGLWRPVTKLTWSLLGGADAAMAPRATALTILLAGLCGGLLAACLRGARVPWVASILVPAAVLLHPAMADVLLPFVGHADLMALAGWLGAWWCWSRRGVAWAGAAGAACLLGGLLAKESILPAALALPLVVGWTRPHRGWWWLWGWAGAAVALRVGLQVAGPGLAPAIGAAGGALESGERHVGAIELLGRHLAGLLDPRPPQTDYSFLKQPGSTAGLHPMLGVMALVVYTGAAVLAWRRRRGHGARLVLAGLLLLAAGLVLHLNIVPIGALWAGRFLLVPLVGVALLAGALARHRPRLVAALSLAIALLGTVQIHRRAGDWRSPSRLWAAEVQRRPDHALAWKNHAALLQQSGETALALEAIERAVTLWPTFGEAWLAHGQIRRANGRPALESLQRATGLMPGHAGAWAELARLHAARREWPAALAAAMRAAALAPHDADLAALLDRIRADAE